MWNTVPAVANMGGAVNFTSHGFAPHGFAAVFTAVSTAGITFSFLGFRRGIELAGETKNPKRNIPMALVGSVVITGILYVLLQMAFTVMVPMADLKKSHGWANVAFTNDAGPLAALATTGGLLWRPPTSTASRTGAGWNTDSTLPIMVLIGDALLVIFEPSNRKGYSPPLCSCTGWPSTRACPRSRSTCTSKRHA